MNGIRNFLDRLSKRSWGSRADQPQPDDLAICAIRLDRLARAIQGEVQDIKTRISGFDQFGDPAS